MNLKKIHQNRKLDADINRFLSYRYRMQTCIYLQTIIRRNIIYMQLCKLKYLNQYEKGEFDKGITINNTQNF